MLAQVFQDKVSSWAKVVAHPGELLGRDVSFLKPDLEMLISEVRDMKSHTNRYGNPDAPYDQVLRNLECSKSGKLTYGDYLDCCAQYLYAICCAQYPQAELGDQTRVRFLEYIYHREGEDNFRSALDPKLELSSIQEEIEISCGEFRHLASSIFTGAYYDGEKSGLLTPVVTRKGEGLDYRSMNEFDSAGCLVVELIPWSDIRLADGERFGPIGHFLHDIDHIRGLNIRGPKSFREISGVEINDLSLEEFSEIARGLGATEDEIDLLFFVLRHEVVVHEDLASLDYSTSLVNAPNLSLAFRDESFFPGLLRDGPVSDFLWEVLTITGYEKTDFIPTKEELETAVRFRKVIHDRLDFVLGADRNESLKAGRLTELAVRILCKYADLKSESSNR